MSQNTNNPNSSNVQGTTMVALYNFDAESDPEMTMKQNEAIEMLDMDPALNGWAYARRKRDGAEGYVPISYLGTSPQQNNRPHKQNKGGNPSRSASPNPGKPRFDDKSSGYNQSNKYQNTRNSSGYNRGNNNMNKFHKYGGNDEQETNSVASTHSNQPQSIQVQHNQNHNPNKGSNNNQNDNPDRRQIICSFHRDFIPDMDDLYKYFGDFGKVVNKIEIEYDSKKVPLAKIKFQSSQCVEKVCDKGNRQQIPSSQQNGTIHIRVYRSMQEYISNTQRSNRGPYKGHKGSRRGGF